MRALIVPLTATAALFATVCSIGANGAEALADAAAYTLLNDQAEQLREDFNRAKGSVRLLFVVDPICPGCLRGLDDVNKDLLAKTPDPRMQTFVVHVPVIGAQAQDVAPAAELLHSANVHHYWNATGELGRQLARAVGLKHGDELVYAWDVWLIYGPEAVWNGPRPPRPRLLMHQLRALEGSAEFPRLDSKVFAQNARALLADLPGANAAAATQE